MPTLPRRLRVCMSLTYYAPHVSGLTVYAQRLARALVRRGHAVTILTSHYERAFPYRERLDGVEVVRAPVAARVEKGVAMPALPLWAWPIIRRSDVVHLHTPQLEASCLAVLAKASRKRIIITHHCDLQLPDLPINRLVRPVVDLSHRVAFRCADRVATNTRDYADSSPLLQLFREKVRPIYPPCEMREVEPGEVGELKARLNLRGAPIIGFVSRLAAEKGVDHLLRALPLVIERFPDAQLALAGEYEKVLGERVFQTLKPLVDELGDRVRFVGHLSDADLPVFFAACQVLASPSVNSTESFGMVQVEAMLTGAPVVASDLPGVRAPIRLTGAGRLCRVADHADLAQQLITVLSQPERYRPVRRRIQELFDPSVTVSAYERLYRGQEDD